MNFGYLFLLPLAAAAAGPRIGKHHSSQGRRSPKIAPRKCMKMPNVTSETHRKWWFWLLFPLAAAMNYEFWLPFPPAPAEAFAAAAARPRMRKHHGSEGRRSPKIAPRKCMKMPNVTSETHRKWWFLRLFLLAAAINFGYLFLLPLQRLLLLLLLVPG